MIMAVFAAASSYFIKARLLVEEQRKSRSAKSNGWMDKLYLLPKATICHSNCIKRSNCRNKTKPFHECF